MSAELCGFFLFILPRKEHSLNPHAVILLLGDLRLISFPAEPLSPHLQHGFTTAYFVDGLRPKCEMVSVRNPGLTLPLPIMIH